MTLNTVVKRGYMSQYFLRPAGKKCQPVRKNAHLSFLFANLALAGHMRPGDSPNHAQPALLRYVPCRLGIPGQVKGISPESLLPSADQHLQRLDPAALAVHNQYFIDNLFNGSVHSTYNSLSSQPRGSFFPGDSTHIGDIIQG